jgi:tetratricopeptide (TPR) repeat protein
VREWAAFQQRREKTLKLFCLLGILLLVVGLVVTVVVLPNVAWVFVQQGVMLREQGDAKAAIETFDEVVKRFEKDTASDVRKQVAWALVHKGVTMREQGDPEAAIETFDEVVKRFEKDTAPDLRKAITLALAGKGLTLMKQGDPEAAIETFDEVVKGVKKH